MKKILKIKRIFNTVKYMTLRQWWYRAYYLLRNKLFKRKSVVCKGEISNIKPLQLNYLLKIKEDKSIKIADDICVNKFVAISKVEVKFEENIDWNMINEEYRLLIFEVNSFDWLLDLSDAYKQSGNRKYLAKGFELINDWVNKNSNIIIGDKWNPYVIAKRLMNWIGFCSEYCEIQKEKISVYAKYIYVQANELSHSIEYQLGANHLLSEAKALLTAGAFLNNSHLYEMGKRILLKEFYKQFLQDGGHYERSISYHIESLQQYFESIAVMQTNDDIDAEKIAKMIMKAYQFLYGMIMVNNKIPLVNDGANNYPFDKACNFIATADYLYELNKPIEVKSEYCDRWRFIRRYNIYMELEKKDLYKYTGYFNKKISIKEKEYSIFFDVGDNGPDSNLGHAHADALNILLVSENKSYFVDSGVFTYKLSSKRNECRSTKSHNTIEIDGINSAEVWSAFRVAKRGHSRIIEYYENKDSFLLKASHDGYKYLKNSIIHTRTIKYDSVSFQLVIEDELYGRGTHIAALRFHLDPDCKITSIWKNGCVLEECIRVNCSIPIEIEPCNIAENFGEMTDSKCIVSKCMFQKEMIVKTIIDFLN